MKLLRIISTTDPEAGGVIESVLQASLAMMALGHEVEILSLDSPESTWLSSLPVKTHAVGPAFSNYAYCPNIKHWLNRNHMNYDAFIIDGLWQYHGPASRKALLQNNRKYSVYPHGMLDPWFKHRYPLKHLKKWLFWPWADYRVLRDAEKVLFTTDEEKTVSRDSFWLYQCNGVVAPIGTSAYDGDIESAKSTFISKYPQLKDRPYFIFLSRIHPKKGLDLLLKAFAANQHLQPELQLVIAGPDQVGWQKDLEKLAHQLDISQKIIWTGMIKDEMKWGAYYNAEAFILPSHQENFGIVVAEALSCGLPVLISDKINIWREVKLENAGIIESDTQDGCNNLFTKWLNLDLKSKQLIQQNTITCFNKHFEIKQAAINLAKTLGY